MVNQQLLDYIRQQLQQGVSREQIKSSLLANGWQEADINETFALISNPAHSPQSPITSQPTITALPGASAILGQAWSLYKQRLGTFLGIMIIPMLVLIGVLAVFVGGGLLGFTLLPAKFAAGGIGLGLLIVLAIAFLLVVFISQIWGQTALLYAIKDSQERIGVMEAYRRGWHKILSYWWVSLLAGFIMMGGFLLLVVPGIIFAVWFSLAMFVLIAEDLKGMNALLKSREYVKGKWGSVLWRFFFIGALSFIISFISLVVGFLIPYGEYVSEFVISLFLTPLTMAYGFLVYSNLKALKGEVAFAPTGGQKAKFIVVAILGVLLIPAIFFSMVFLRDSVREKERDARREADIKQIQIGLEMHYAQYERYPFSLNELSPQYLPTTPVDPKTNLPYQYQRRGDADYQVCAQLEAKTQKCVTSQF